MFDVRILQELGELSKGKKSPKEIQDFYVIRNHKGLVVVTVGDWANNHVGGPWIDKEVNNYLGFSEDKKLNGGLIGKVVVEKALKEADLDLSGENLIKYLNGAIRDEYKKLGILSEAINNPAHRFTGYFSNAIIKKLPNGKLKLEITSLGDVHAFVNGERISGEEKGIDKLHEEFRREYIRNTGRVDEAYFESMKPLIINQQFRQQNNPSGEAPYGAIDGIETLMYGPKLGEEQRKYYQHLEDTLPGQSNIILATDGYNFIDGMKAERIEDLEEMLFLTWYVDPGRFLKYLFKGTVQGDRTAVEIFYRGNYPSTAIVNPLFNKNRKTISFRGKTYEIDPEYKEQLTVLRKAYESERTGVGEYDFQIIDDYIQKRLSEGIKFLEQ